MNPTEPCNVHTTSNNTHNITIDMSSNAIRDSKASYDRTEVWLEYNTVKASFPLYIFRFTRQLLFNRGLCCGLLHHVTYRVCATISEKGTDCHHLQLTEFVQEDSVVTENMSVIYEGSKALGQSQLQKYEGR